MFKKKFRIIKPVKPKLNLNTNEKLDEKFIVFIDQNLNHADSVIRGYKLNERTKKVFLSN